VVHLTFLTGFKNRVSALGHWTVSFLGRSRSERTITEQQIVARLAIEATRGRRADALAGRLGVGVEDVRISRFKIFPVALRGSCWVEKVIRDGTLKGPAASGRVPGAPRRSAWHPASTRPPPRPLRRADGSGDPEHGGPRRRPGARRWPLPPRGVDVLPAPTHHVLRPVFDVDEAVRVQVADVAAAEPTLHDGLGGPRACSSSHE